MALQVGKPVDDLGTVRPARVGLACPGALMCTATSFDRLSIVVTTCVCVCVCVCMCVCVWCVCVCVRGTGLL